MKRLQYSFASIFRQVNMPPGHVNSLCNCNRSTLWQKIRTQNEGLLSLDILEVSSPWAGI